MTMGLKGCQENPININSLIKWLLWIYLGTHIAVLVIKSSKNWNFSRNLNRFLATSCARTSRMIFVVNENCICSSALPPRFVLTVRYDESSNNIWNFSHTIICFQFFDATTWDNDIALVKLRRPLDLEEHAGLVNTICLPTRNMSFLGLQCSVTGWGRTKKREHMELLGVEWTSLSIRNHCMYELERDYTEQVRVRLIQLWWLRLS